LPLYLQISRYSGEVSPETPLREYNSKKCYLVLPTRYSRGSIPLFRGVSRRNRVFPLKTPELNQNILLLIEEIILIIFNSILIF